MSFRCVKQASVIEMLPALHCSRVIDVACSNNNTGVLSDKMLNFSDISLPSILHFFRFFFDLIHRYFVYLRTPITFALRTAIIIGYYIPCDFDVLNLCFAVCAAHSLLFCLYSPALLAIILPKITAVGTGMLLIYLPRKNERLSWPERQECK